MKRPLVNLLSVKDVSKILNLHPMTVYVLARTRQLPSVKIGRSVKFTEEGLERFIKERERTAA